MQEDKEIMNINLGKKRLNDLSADNIITYLETPQYAFKKSLLELIK